MARSSVSHLDTFEKSMAEWRPSGNARVRIQDGALRVIPVRGPAGVEADFESQSDWMRFRAEFNGRIIMVSINDGPAHRFLFSDSRGFDILKFDFARPLAQSRRITIKITSDAPFNLRNFYLLRRPVPGEIHHHIDSRRRAFAPPPRTQRYGTPVGTLTLIGPHLQSVLWTIERSVAPQYILHRNFELEDQDDRLTNFHPVEIVS